MQIIFSRHGNTFNPGQSTVWVDAKLDLPLVDSGIEQAKTLARAIRNHDLKLNAIYCSPLKRTLAYANIIISELALALRPCIDSRLTELDYGRWSGLNQTQIQQLGDGMALEAWEHLSQWPQAAGWLDSPELVTKQISDFAYYLIKEHTPTDKILIITSNGRLRYFLKLIPDAFECFIQAKTFKVATGHICSFNYHKKWQLQYWNEPPGSLAFKQSFPAE